MSDVPAQGALAKMAFDASAITGASTGVEFVSTTLKRRDTHVYSRGIRGTRSRSKSRARIARTEVSGQIVLEPSASEIDFLLPYILGGTTAAGVTDVADALPEFVIGIDKVSKVYTYAGCRVARAVFAGQSGQALQLTLDIEAETETQANAGTFPAITLPTDNFFVMSDVTLTLLSVARKFASFTLTIDNMVDADRYLNSLTRTEIAAQDRSVRLEVSAPFTSDNTDLYGAAIAGAAGSLVVSDGSVTYTMNFGNAKIPAEGQDVSGKSEIMLPLTVDLFHDDASASELKITKT